MANAYGNLRANNVRRHADTDDDVPSNTTLGGVTYGDRVHIGPEGSTDPQTAPQSTETAPRPESGR
jgi:hypothetical protein